MWRLEGGEEVNHVDICEKTIQAEGAAIKLPGQGAKSSLRGRAPVNDRIIMLITWEPWKKGSLFHLSCNKNSFLNTLTVELIF